MIRIAVVDDEKETCDSIAGLLRKYESKQNIYLELKTYLNGENLLFDFSESLYYDLILLDIEMEKINGVEIGTLIRNKYENYKTKIIYISSKTKYAMQLFEIMPFNFLEKPISEENLYPCLDKYIKLYINDLFFEYKVRNEIKKIPINDIVYIESSGKYLTIHCNSVDYTYREKLANIIKNECFKDFIRIHQSAFVNVTYISSYDYNSIKVRISDKTIELNISRSYCTDVRRIILEHRADSYK